MDQIELVTKLPTAEQYLELRELVGWRGREVADAEVGLAGSLHGVCAMQGDVLVGMARVVGDGRSVFYVQDVIVRPGHQGLGIGRAVMEKIMDYIAAHACKGAVVGLMAAVGKEPFYEKFGFHTRPNEREGAGMLQFWGT